MTEIRHDVVGIGNAIVDVLVQVDDALVAEHALPKGAMTLIDAAQAEAIYWALPPGIECSGGSVANSIAGLAALGGRGAYLGRVRDDQLGQVFRHDVTALGVHFPTPAAGAGPATARCLVLVTPDAQRTMATYLGACVELGPDDLDLDAIAAAAVTYVEGYLWDPPEAKRAIRIAAARAQAAGRKVALSLSDAFCVNRHRDEFNELIDNAVDLLFANEAELLALTGADDFEEGAARIAGRVAVAALTRSERGSTVVTRAGRVDVPATTLGPVVDTTGAGDLYAAGFLYGWTRDWEAADCARLGSLAAAEVISHIGARPQADLRALAAKHLPDLFPA